ncbi:energy transducer TonB [Pseudomonas sp. 2FG]|uniref:energy transducer TonB n=1 Tax=Pseudomonas sp. 2FG TaxID=2502191 RepID=UPI0010F48AF0|nr:energy transducer TonB [Pseudomonas sp. 2FG]
MLRFSLYFLLSLALHALAGLLLRDSTLGLGRPQVAEVAVMTIQLQAAPRMLSLAPSATPPAPVVQAPAAVAPAALARAKVPARVPAKASPQRPPAPPKPVRLAAKTAPAVSRGERATLALTAAAAPVPMQPASREVFSSAPAFLQSPVPPRYPAQAKRRNQQGVVLLEVRLDERGRQRALQVLRSSGVASLDAAAVQAVAAWRFRPETEDGRAVPSRVQIPVEFALTASR